MSYSEQDREFLSHIHHLRSHDRPGYISVLCALARHVPPEQQASEPWEELISATRGDFKRAIKSIRSVQADHTDPEWLEEIVLYIRREWLHRGEEATE